jgi:hypothetical protein
METLLSEFKYLCNEKKLPCLTESMLHLAKASFPIPRNTKYEALKYGIEID